MFQLRPFQKAALLALEKTGVCSNHVLCVAPTGSGKSLIYEKAAAKEGRRTLLLTPLVALARQQHERLKKAGIPVGLGAGGGAEGPPAGGSGAWIVSPEMLLFHSHKAALREWNPNFLVVDECHCLWEWGEDFRPAFTLIPELLRTYSIRRSLWLTATLPYQARRHLRKLIADPLIELGGFELPPRLHLEIRSTPWPQRSGALMKGLNERRGFGLVFVPTREATQRISRLIAATGKTVVAYHGGMASEERRNIETQVSNKIPEVIVATSAFGMGMDYPHLSYVVLWQAPTSILSLVQIIGRVGRNLEKEGHALVLWDREDFRLLEWSIRDSMKRKRDLEDLLQFLNTRKCRLAGLKRYFDGEVEEGSCGRCDYCQMMNRSRNQIGTGFLESDQITDVSICTDPTLPGAH